MGGSGGDGIQKQDTKYSLVYIATELNVYCMVEAIFYLLHIKCDAF